MLGKNTILKAIHNSKLAPWLVNLVWMLGKNTILKAIHNYFDEAIDEHAGVNAG